MQIVGFIAIPIFSDIDNGENAMKCKKKSANVRP